MRYSKNSTDLIYILIIFFYIIRFTCSDFMEDVFLMYLIPTFWVTISIYLKSNNLFDKRSKIDQTQKKILPVVIIITSYILLNFVLGLIVSFGKNPYYEKALLNLWEFIFYIFPQEYTRFVLLNNRKKKAFDIIFIILLFTVIEIQSAYFFSCLRNGKISDYISYILIPIILDNIISTYFAVSYDSGYILSSIYRAYLALYTYSVPIYPTLSQNSIILLKILMILFLLFYCKSKINNKIKKSKKTYNPARKKKLNYLSNAIIFSIFFILALLFSGVTNYFLLAIGSNSMHGHIEIGDIVIVEKIDREHAISSLRVGDVVIYKLDNILVVHRIIKIGKLLATQEPYYITKGDNNPKPDVKKVLVNQIVGTTKYKIPYLGYPSVLITKYL